MQIASLWITGTTRSGKTTRLVQQFVKWVEQQNAVISSSSSPTPLPLTPAILVFAANDSNRRKLAENLAIAVEGSYPVITKTPLGFIADEVILFWPLVFERLNLKAQFPLQLRPETEQELATQLWRGEFEKYDLSVSGNNEYRLVRRTLDLLQLAGASGINPEEIPYILEQGLPSQDWGNVLLSNLGDGEENVYLWQHLGKLLLQWREWCLERGLLSYGLIYELYWRYLLCDRQYQQQLIRRYQAIFADDVDDYPAIAKDLFTFLLNQGAVGTFTYNPDSKVRLGLNADPHYLQELSSRCHIEELSAPTLLQDTVIAIILGSEYITNIPPTIQSIQTTSRAALLRQTTKVIIQAIENDLIKPQEIAIIAPGLDEIARYTLIEILTTADIKVEPLNEQRPLISSPLVRGLLTLLALIYPGLGRLVDRDKIAEMLVVLSYRADQEPAIDAVRAGLLADHCYLANPQYPQLLAVESFARWDRLGYQATKTYGEIREWLTQTREQQQQQTFPTVISVLDRAIKYFIGNPSSLPYPQLAALRELMETAEHYWQVNRRLRQNEPLSHSPTHTITQFILLLRRGTITANPYPLNTFTNNPTEAITLATVFQYRAARSYHRWQFWLDAGSPLWNQGGAATLFAYPLFLREWTGRPWMPEDEAKADQERLERILRDLLGRVGEQVYLCHSDLAVNGTEQTGPLLNLVYRVNPLG